MSRKHRKRSSRAERKETRKRGKPTCPENAQRIVATAPATPITRAPDEALPKVHREAKPSSKRHGLRRSLIALGAIGALLAGNLARRAQPLLITPGTPRGTGTTSETSVQPPAESPVQAPTNLKIWIDKTLADFNDATLSAFRLGKLLRERFNQSGPEQIREYILSEGFSEAPQTVRHLALRRLAEVAPNHIRSLFETVMSLSLNAEEIHTLLGAQCTSDPAGFTQWLNSLPPPQQTLLAPELSHHVAKEPARIALAISNLSQAPAQSAIRSALTRLSQDPETLLAFTVELPAHLSTQATLQGLTTALSLPHVSKRFRLSDHPHAVSLIHESIRSRMDAEPYRDLLAAEGVADALPKGVARSLGLESLFQRIASIHLDTALLRLSKLTRPEDLEYAAVGVISGCAKTHPMRALELAANLPTDSPRRHQALLLAAYAARALDRSILQQWLTSARLNPDERVLLTGEAP